MIKNNKYRKRSLKKVITEVKESLNRKIHRRNTKRRILLLRKASKMLGVDLAVYLDAKLKKKKIEK